MMAGVDSLPIAEKVAFRRQSIRTMGELVDLATLMIRAEDFQRGRDNFFAPARKIWFMFGGTIKRFDAALGGEIESLFNSINTTLDQASPAKEALVNSLAELNRLMATAVSISDERL